MYRHKSTVFVKYTSEILITSIQTFTEKKKCSNINALFSMNIKKYNLIFQWMMLLYIHIWKPTQMYQPQKNNTSQKKTLMREKPLFIIPSKPTQILLIKKKNKSQKVCQNIFRLTANNLEVHTVWSLVQETNLIWPSWFIRSQEDCNTLTRNAVFSDNKEKVGKSRQKEEGTANGTLQRHQRHGWGR